MSAAATNIANAVKTAVEALSLAGVTVVRRKTPSVPEGTSAGLPQVVVSVREDVETERLTAVTKRRRFRFAVTIVTAGGQKLADDDTVHTWRESIDDAVFDKQRATFSAVAGFIHLKALGGPVFDPAALPKDFNYSPLSYEAELIESLAT